MNYFELLDKIYYKGVTIRPRNEETKEIINAELIIDEHNFYYTEQFRSFEKVSKYLFAEIPWYWSGNTNNSFIKPYAKMWEEIENPDGTNNSNYGNLVYYKQRKSEYGDNLTGFQWALQNLKKDMFTRKAIITYNDGHYNWIENTDYICSQCQHFMIRDYKLICIIYLRSSDAIFGLQYNIPWWSLVHQDLYLQLLQTYPMLELGGINVHIGSAHLYERHYDLAINMLLEERKSKTLKLLKPLKLGLTAEEYKEKLFEWVQI